VEQVAPSNNLPRPHLRARGWGREIRETLLLIAAIYALVNLATVRFIVDGPSMQPNFHTDEVIVVSRLNYMFGDPQRGDVAVFNPPNQSADEPPYIKRVIGVPGDTIEIRDQRVFVNGVQMEEPYINEACRADRCPDKIWSLGANEYFMMGDNRNHSQDSRAFSTPVTRERIIGEALVRYWPPAAWGIVSRIRYPEGVNPP
jgi:signal peptidase I